MEVLTSLRTITILVTYMHLTGSKEVVLCSPEQMLCFLAEKLRHFLLRYSRAPSHAIFARGDESRKYFYEFW